MATEAELKAISNTQLASGTEIPATKHRTVNDAIIEEMYNAQSRGDVLSGVQSSGSLASGDLVFVIRSGEAYLLDSSEFGFIDTLAALTDTNITAPSNNQILAYNTATSKWRNIDISTIITGVVTKTSGTLTDGATVTVNGGSKDQAIFDWTANTASVSLVFSSGTAAQVTSIFGKKTLAGDVTVTLDTTNYHFVDASGSDISDIVITNDNSTNEYFKLLFIRSSTIEEGSNPVIIVEEIGSSGSGSGSVSFLGLEDTPSSYTSRGGDVVNVNDAETALETSPTVELDLSSVVGKKVFSALEDTPSSYTSRGGDVVNVNDAETALETSPTVEIGFTEVSAGSVTPDTIFRITYGGEVYEFNVKKV